MSHRFLVVAVSLAIIALLQPAAGAEEDGARTRYVVVLERSAGPVREAARQLAPDVRPFRTYTHALRGFAARLTTMEVARLRADPTVAAVVRDRTLRLAASQVVAPWGLDRIDQHFLPRDNTFNFTATGAGVTAYVIDTGIQAAHPEFQGRVIAGKSFLGVQATGDCNGHGTHVSGILGGTTFGVAKGVTLVPVRVLDCYGFGTLSGVLKGVDWVTAHHPPGAPAVANMSLGGPSIKVLNQAVKVSIADGITYTVAAGNAGADACKFSPARVGPAITVSATNPKDARPAWANYGRCVDLFAPGTSIRSAWDDGNSQVVSGTSMAAPHAAGVAALYLESSPSASPLIVRNALASLATKNVVRKAKSLKKHLLFTNL